MNKIIQSNTLSNLRFRQSLLLSYFFLDHLNPIKIPYTQVKGLFLSDPL